MPNRPEQPAGRADRILDAAGELLLRLGYRKVTVEDVARRAGIGKGTIYLHWRTKDLLFEAVLMRESIELTEEIVTGLRDDPSEARPHRLMHATFVAMDRKPLVRALFTGDMELLGRLTDSSLVDEDALATDRFIDLMTRHGLLRADIPNLPYALRASVLGFFLLYEVDPSATGLSTQDKADALARTVHHAFESAAEPDPAVLNAAAPELVTVLEDMIAAYRTWIYSQDPAPQPG